MVKRKKEWIPAGRGVSVAALTSVVDDLTDKWGRRYEYQIVVVPDQEDPAQRYELRIKHQ